MVLNSGQIESFRRDGFVHLPALLTPAELEECRARVDSYMGRTESPAIFRFGKDGRWIHCKLPQLAERDALFRRVAQHSAVSEVVEDLLGPALIFRDVLIAKAPVAGAVVHYHQDAAYWDVDRPDRVLSAWIALDDAPAEAGCLQVVPGSHVSPVDHTLLMSGKRLPAWFTGILRRATSLTGTGDNPQTAREKAFAGAKKLVLGSATRLVPALNDLNDLRIDPRRLPSESLVTLPAKAGDVVFFSSWLIHGSGPNTASHPRRAYIVTYMNAECRVSGREQTHFLPARA